LLRQIWWTSIPVWSIGFLSFVPFLRIALGRRRKKDWLVLTAYLAAVVGLAAVVSITTHGAGATVAGACVLGLMGFAAAHTAFAFRPSRGDPGPSSPAERPDNRQAIEAARHRMEQRKASIDLARSNPALARELRIGRPDLPREYDDGGLVDLNHVPGHILAAHLGLSPDEVTAVIAARDKLGAFSSAEELSAYAELAPGRVDELRDLMFFG
jgi:hypothetical protein